MTNLLVAVVAALISVAKPTPATHQEITVKQTTCLAEAVYHESRGESVDGQMAVAYVVLHRATQTNESLCDVIHKPHQFAFYSEGHEKRVTDIHAWRMAAMIAVMAQTTQTYDHHDDIMYFTGGKIHPWKNTRYVMTIGAHHFYANIPKTEPNSKPAQLMLVAQTVEKSSSDAVHEDAKITTATPEGCQSRDDMGYGVSTISFPIFGFGGASPAIKCVPPGDKLLV